MKKSNKQLIKSLRLTCLDLLTQNAKLKIDNKELRKQFSLQDVVNTLKDKKAISFEEWYEENCIKVGDKNQFRLSHDLYSDEEIKQKYNTAIYSF
tara:strand:- start:211 stop:495 length:285 start_codon:yes stop_codon:yes gene_type:complete